jgi:hypothetical protein
MRARPYVGKYGQQDNGEDIQCRSHTHKSKPAVWYVFKPKAGTTRRKCAQPCTSFPCDKSCTSALPKTETE